MDPVTTAEMASIMSKFIIFCGGFTSICIAGGWLIKVIKGVKKPVDDFTDSVDKKLHADKNRLDAHDERLRNVDDILSDLVEDNKVIKNTLYALLKHAQTNNNTGGMAKAEEELFASMNK